MLRAFVLNNLLLCTGSSYIQDMATFSVNSSRQESITEQINMVEA